MNHNQRIRNKTKTDYTYVGGYGNKNLNFLENVTSEIFYISKLYHFFSFLFFQDLQ